MSRKMTAKELKTVRTAATYLRKAADIIYKRGDGNLYANSLSEKAFALARSLRSY